MPSLITNSKRNQASSSHTQQGSNQAHVLPISSSFPIGITSSSPDAVNSSSPVIMSQPSPGVSSSPGTTVAQVSIVVASTSSIQTSISCPSSLFWPPRGKFLDVSGLNCAQLLAYQRLINPPVDTGRKNLACNFPFPLFLKARLFGSRGSKIYLDGI